MTVTVAKILNTNAMVPGNRIRIRSSASHIPGKRNPKQNSDGRNRNDEDESSAEARSRDQPVQFDDDDHGHVNRREVFENRVG